MNGGSDIWPTTMDNKYNVWRNVETPLAKNYNQLSSEQVVDLMKKYRANYFLTKKNHQLDLNIVYQNEQYIIYGNLDQIKE